MKFTERFINQYTNGYGNYTEERRELFADQTLDGLIDEIKQRRSERASRQPSTPKAGEVHS